MNTLPEPRRVIVGIDDSKYAEHAATWAAGFAADLGAALHLVHVIKLDGVGSLFTSLSYAEYQRAVAHDAQALVDRLQAHLTADHPKLRVTSGLSSGDPAQVLIAQTRPTDVLVVGTRGHGGFAGLLLGSVGLRLATHSTCPVVLVPDESRDQGDPAGEIILGVEAGQGGQAADFAFGVAERLAAPVRAVHVWESVPPFNGYYFVDPGLSLAEAERELERGVRDARARYPGVGVATRAVNGVAAGTLIDLADGARLLVVGAHRRRGPLSAGVGAVLHPLLAHSPCPLAVVPSA